MARRTKGEGTLRKRKDGRWEGWFNIGKDEKDKTKKRYRKNQIRMSRKAEQSQRGISERTVCIIFSYLLDQFRSHA